MTTNKLKALAVAASATVLRYTPATIGKITREDMAVCQAYQVAAVPGHIVEMFDEIERLTVNRGFLLADLQEAATTLRRYETLHRAKGTEESTAKAEVNAELAARFESTIKAVQQ